MAIGLQDGIFMEGIGICVLKVLNAAIYWA